MEKTIYDLKMNESLKYSSGADSTLDVEITRVPGGWIYNFIHKVVDKQDIVDFVTNTLSAVLNLSEAQKNLIRNIRFPMPGIWQSNPVFIPFSAEFQQELNNQRNTEDSGDPGEVKITTGASPDPKKN
jgi:hypothetical protein